MAGIGVPRALKMNQNLYILVLFSLLLPLFATKLNVPHALLPLSYDFTVNYTLEVTENEGGCYSWSTLRPHILKLECIDLNAELGCCSRVVVSSNIKQHSRHTDTVLAEDVHSGVTLRCEVILDVIHRLDILTTTREIFLDESPEAFEVRAYDDQGNTFSTLDGVAFDWHFRTDGVSKANGESTVVRYMTFSESRYETSPAIEALERQGLKGYLVLVEGRQTGSAAISVQLPQPEYAHVAPATVQLLVMSNLIITPRDSMLLIGDSIQYRLLQFTHGKMSEIFFPSAQYHLKTKDSLIEVNKETGVVTGRQLGSTKLILVDSNVGIAPQVKPPTASVTVSTPHDLSLALLPSRKWTVIVGDFYDIEAELYDASRKIFTIGSAVVINIRINDRYFNVKYRSQNGSFIHGTPIKTGRTEVIGEFIGVGTEKLTPLTAASELLIYERIRVSPEVLIVAWDSKLRARYELPLKVTGGDGSFSWSSSKSAVAAVTQRGVVKTFDRGVTNITAAMTVNPSLRGTSMVYVLPPTSLEILDTPLEAQVGTEIRIYVALYTEIDGKKMPFSACHLLPFVVTLSEEGFEKQDNVAANTENLYSPSCGIVKIVGKKSAACQVTIEYGILSDSVHIAAYNPLVPLNPVSGNTVLAVGTTRIVAFHGGPRSWKLRPTEHFYTLNNDQNDAVLEVREIVTRSGSHQLLYAWNVECRALSRTKLTLQVVNKALGSLSEPTFATASITVDCGQPKHLLLAPYLKNLPRCPLGAEEMVTLKNQDLVLEVIVQDAQGNTFDNITSLEIEWFFSKPIYLSINNGPQSVTYELENLTFPETHISKLIPTFKESLNMERILEIQAHVTGYNQEILFAQNIIDDAGIASLVDSIMVKIVEPAVIEPNVTHLDADAGKNVFQRVDILHGSGHFELAVIGSGIVTAELVTMEKSVIQLAALSIGQSLVTISDCCLHTPDASLSVQVCRLSGISLTVPEFIERGHTVQAHVNLHDECGYRSVSQSDVEHFKPIPIPASDLISVHPYELIDGSIVFTVRGDSLGLTSLSVKIKDMTSPPVSMQVFSEFQVQPRNLTLLVGGSMQMSTIGGPSAANIEWSINNQTVGVTADGIVTGIHIGGALLTARAFTLNKHTGERVLCAKDSVEVRVVPLSGVAIHAPITRLVVGGKMPLWAVPKGNIGDSATWRHLAATMARFSWTINQDDLAILQTGLHPFGVHVMDVDQLAMQLHTVRPGRITITLTVNRLVAGLEINNIDGNIVEYKDSLTINILPELTVRSPRPLNYDPIRLSTHSTTDLGFSQQIRKLNVTVIDGPKDVVKISTDGVITTGSASGAAIVAYSAIDGSWQYLTISVKPIEYIMINAVADWRLRAQPHEPFIHVLPVGLDAEFSVSFHDDVGNQFDAVQSNIRVDSYPKGLLRVNQKMAGKNETFVLSILDNGISSVRVWDTKIPHQPADHVVIRSADVLYPTFARISIGDVICFRLPVSFAEKPEIQWTVDDSEKLRLSTDLGIAVACGGPRGLGLVTVSHRSVPGLRSRIEIIPMEKLEFLQHDVQIVTTTFDNIVDYRIVLLGAEQNGKRNNLIASNNTCDDCDFIPSCFPFMCNLKFNNPAAPIDIGNIFKIEPAFNIATGQYSCRIQGIAPTSQATATLTETLVLEALSTDGSIQTPSKVLPFMPALHLHQNQLKITFDDPNGIFVLSGVQQVFNQIQVIWDKQYVSVTETDQEETTRTFKVGIYDSWWKLEKPWPLSVTIRSPATKQILKIPIECSCGSGGTDDSPSLLPVIIAITLVIGTAIGMKLSNINRKKEDVKNVIATSRPGLFQPHESLSPRTVDLNRSHSSSSPLRQNDYPVYGSPWRRQSPR